MDFTHRVKTGNNHVQSIIPFQMRLDRYSVRDDLGNGIMLRTAKVDFCLAYGSQRLGFHVFGLEKCNSHREHEIGCLSRKALVMILTADIETDSECD